MKNTAATYQKPSMKQHLEVISALARVGARTYTTFRSERENASPEKAGSDCSKLENDHRSSCLPTTRPALGTEPSIYLPG